MPLKKFQCSECGAKAPKKYLEHGMMDKRMEWLRRHYKNNHPGKFREMFK